MADDTFFGPRYIDVDEWRDTPWRHRYVHGGFEGTDTRFSVYLPEPGAYNGRWLQWLQGGAGGSEHVAAAGTSLTVAHQLGAYVVESNQGHLGNDISGLRGDQTILQWRASVASARAAREIATEMYGIAPHHGYVSGGSGGAMRTTFCLEHAPDLYDGGVAFMLNHGGLAAYFWSLMARAQLLLRDKLDAVVDAVDAGGSGDPYRGLDDEQRNALALLYRAGLPRGAEHLLVENAIWVLGLQSLLGVDPGFFEDFWSQPGYAGFEQPDSLARLAVDVAVRVSDVVTASQVTERIEATGQVAPGGVAPGVHLGLRSDFPVGVRTDLDASTRGLTGARITIISGASAGRTLLSTGFAAGALTAMVDPVGFAGVEPGDTLQLDNRDYIAFAHLHRHVYDASHPSTTLLAVDGIPLYPVRHRHLDAVAAMGSGRIDRKLILLQHTLDRECFPECADFFVHRVHAHLGNRLDDSFRLWWIDNAAHLVPTTRAGLTRLISYAGCYHRALHHLVGWVEEGTAPPGSTPYSFSADRALQLPPTAAERQGIQPVVGLEVGGGVRAEVDTGTPVALTTTAQVPPWGLRVTRIEWDVDGTGTWPYACTDLGEGADVRAAIEHTFDEPGTAMVATRVSCEPDSDAPGAAFPVQNIARARVIVRGRNGSD